MAIDHWFGLGHNWRRRLHHGRWIVLLCSLLLLLVLDPFLDGPLGDLIVWEVLFTLVVLSQLHLFSIGRRLEQLAIVLAVPTLVTLWARYVYPSPELTVATLICLAGFLTFTAVVALHLVLDTDIVTADTVAGALSVYLLAGFLWGVLYALVFLSDPSAFRLPPDEWPGTISDISDDVRLDDFFFFSFITLTTVGYGDVVPVSQMARSLAMLEGVLGQFYLAVLVARLVGLHIANPRKS